MSDNKENTVDVIVDGFDLDEETAEQIDGLVAQLFDFREINNLPVPSDKDIEKLVEHFLNIKEYAALYCVLEDGAAFLDIKDGAFEIITNDDGTCDCPECMKHRKTLN